MKQPIKIIMKAIILIAIYSMLAPYAVAAEGRLIAKKESSWDSLYEAASRSREDHGKMKEKVQEEKMNRQAAWAERGTGAIEIQGSGAFTGTEYLSSNEGTPGAGEVDIYDKGDDHSGLESLKSQVKLESTDTDFDAELKDIHRGIDSDLKEQQKVVKK